ncbi:hypothetical protein SO802_029347 [Lithocarpus litseifolius]|uniref:DYW domain-containing protein n=1 Tax=Lithocarpus litseifolius TaxID=425828 RepID=A0AAW2BTX5_9ROSI
MCSRFYKISSVKRKFQILSTLCHFAYTFVAGGKQDKITEEAYEKLREIISKLRIEGGYVPEVGSVLHDIEEEEKEDSVSRHSEKLALAFGMARLCEGRVIRIVKNLRVCRDCHVVKKLISRVYRLEISVRDRSRFHSFRDGSCSCKDYWSVATGRISRRIYLAH